MALKETQVRTRRDALQADVEAAYQDLVAHKITQKTYDQILDRAEDELRKLNHKRAALAHVGSSSPSDYQEMQRHTGFKAVRSKNLSPLDITSDQLGEMYEAARARQPYRCEIKTKTLDSGAPNIGLKTAGSPVTEGAPWPTGLLPPDLRPELSLELRYEPDRLADHIETITVDAPSVEYLIHSGNLNQPGVVAELGTKQDIGMQLTTATAVPVKIAALASVSMEALADFSYFASWIPRELQRSLIWAETDQIAMGTGSSGTLPGMTGFVSTSGVLTRAYNSSTDQSGIDTLLRAFNDVRVGSSFGEVDVVAMHPTTWNYLRRTKTTTNAYVLGIMDPEAIGQLKSLWGVQIVENTAIPVGTAVAFDSRIAAKYFVRQALTLDVNRWGDTEWTTNSVSFRAEMRSVLAVTRPTAVNVVTNLGPTGGS
jgi:HK97 family phage major capsid protein